MRLLSFARTGAMGMRALLLLALSAAMAAPPAHARSIGKAKEFLQEAQDHYREGDFPSAMSALSKSLSQHSGYLPAYALRAQVRHVTGDREGMIRDIQQALRISSPREADIFTLRGDARLLNGDLDEARTDFAQAVEADPEYPDAHLGMARWHRARGDWAETVRSLRTALKFDPNLYVARFDLAWAYYESGKEDLAIREATRALRGNPAFPLPYNLLGVIFARQGDFDRAFKAYSKAILLLPEFSYAYMGRGLAHLKAGKNRLGMNDLKQAVDVAPWDYAPLYNRGEALLRTGKETEALEDFKSALPLKIPHPPASYAMGRRFLAAFKHEEAVEMFGKCLDAAKSHPDPAMSAWIEKAHLSRADAYEGLKKYQQALMDLDDAVEVSSMSALAWTSRGKLLHKLGKSDKALSDFNEALKLDGKYAPALLARGNVLVKDRKYVDALKDFSAAIASDPELSDAYNNRGVLYADAFAEYDRAVEDLEKAVELQDASPGYQLNLGIVRYKRKNYRSALAALESAEKKRAPMERVLLYRAKARYALGDAAKAHADIDAAIELAPKDVELLTTKGRFYLASHEFHDAMRILKKAIRMDKKDDQALMSLGLAHGGLVEYSRASRWFRQAAKWAEKPTEALTYLCQSERLRGRARRAIRECEKALQFDPDYGPAYIQRGLAFLALADYPKAIRDIDDGTRLSTARAEVYLARSLAHIPLKQYRESDEAYRKATALDYHAKAADLTFGGLPSSDWDYERRVDSFARELERDGDNPYTNLVRGNALHNAGYFDRAILEYTRAMEINGRLTAAYLNRGAALAAQDSMDAAEFDYRRAVELSPSDPETHLGLVTLLTARRKYALGLKTVIAALRKQTDNPNPETFVKAGNLRYFMKDVKRAQVNFDLALKFDPHHAAAYNGLGLCHFSRREYGEAIENFSRAIAIEPGNPQFLRNRASTYVNMKDFASAASDYKLALRLNKDPEMVDQYEDLIANSERMIKAAPDSASARTKAGKSDQ